jgi:hypothetical protein
MALKDLFRNGFINSVAESGANEILFFAIP